MALTIPEQEMDLCKELVRPAFVAISLTNDLFSWEKECDSAKNNRQPHVVNAIWVLMGELAVPDEARTACRQKIKASVEEYLLVLQELQGNRNVSRNLQIYVEAIQYSLSGNLIWSVYWPRYHPEATYDPTKLSMMTTIAPSTQEICEG